MRRHPEIEPEDWDDVRDRLRRSEETREEGPEWLR